MQGPQRKPTIASLIIAAIAALALARVAPAAAAAASNKPDRDPPRTALVLSGGGARGAAHIGVIEILEELEIPVDVIIGTSMGAIIGGLYASGLSTEEMRSRIGQIDWVAAFNDRPPRKFLPFRQKQEDRAPLFHLEAGVGPDGFSMPSGFVAGQKLNFFLRVLTMHSAGVDDFDELPVPFRAVAVDLDSGETVVLDHGDLAKSMRASMAFPAAFTPVEIDGRQLVDGGVTLNLPVEIALKMGAERIIAVDVGTPLKSMDKKDPSILGVLRRTYSVMAKQGLGEQREMLRDQDVLIIPDLEEITTFGGFTKLGLAMDRGVEAARAHEKELRSFSVEPHEFEGWLKGQRRRPLGEVTVGEISVTGVNRVSPKIVANRMRTRPGDWLDLEQLQDDLERVYKIGEFQQVAFRIENLDKRRVRLIIEAMEKSWGPWFLRVGSAIEANLEGLGRFTLTGMIRRPMINRLGAEWRTFLGIGDRAVLNTEFFQPLTYDGRFFVSGYFDGARFGEVPVLVGREVEPIDLSYWSFGADLGYQFGNWAELRVGLLRGELTYEQRLDELTPPDVNTGLGRVKFVLDRLDHPNFPRQGAFIDLQYHASRESLGAEATDTGRYEYDRLSFRAAQAGKLGKNTLLGYVQAGSDLGSTLPDYARFPLGGFLRLSGLDRNSLVGSRSGVLSLIGFRQFGSAPQGVGGGGTFFGFSLEGGAVWQDEEDPSFSDLEPAGSIWAGADTILGPVYLGVGFASGGNRSVYLFLGPIFDFRF